MADIRIDTTFRDHRKRKRLAADLGADGVLALVDLWLSVAQTRPDGVLAGMDVTDIELDAQWPGEPGAFVSACVGRGFLDLGADGVYRVHNWEEHQPWVIGAKARADHARTAAVKRWGRSEHAPAVLTGCSEHATSMRGACSPQCPSPILSSPILSQPNTPIAPKGARVWTPRIVAIPPEAEAIYQAYPRHDAKQPALKAIAKALAKTAAAELLAAVTEYAEAVKGQETKYIPHPASWFNDERWTDDRATWTAWKAKSTPQPQLALGQIHHEASPLKLRTMKVPTT
jgi:hypothetical protein